MMDFEGTVFFNQHTYLITGSTFLIAIFSLFFLRRKIKSIGVNLIILGLVFLTLVSIAKVFNWYFFDPEKIKEVIMWQYLIECVIYLLMSLGLLIFSLELKSED